MSEKRRDSKGRILKAGESQRKDGLYQYRYKDIGGERRTIYDRDLNELRKKEKEIAKCLDEHTSYFEGNIQLKDLIDKTYALKRKWRDSTRSTMNRYLKIISSCRLYTMSVNKIKIADCKSYMVELYDKGYSYGTIATVYSILKMSFDLAVDDEIVSKNPCSFMLKTVVDDNTKKVNALTGEQEKSLFKFLKEDTYGKKRIDMFIILIGTGMRISEFAALTMKDIDFKKNVIHVRKQIVRLVGSLKITDLKTDSAYRDIPMTKEVRESISNLIAQRQKIKCDRMIDGHVGFLSVTLSGRPRTHSEYADAFRKLMKRYNETNEIKIECCTPHVLRHTFCTKCIAAGMDVKSVQYLMGHSDASTTLNVYTDEVFDNVVSNMKMLNIMCN